MKVLSLPTVSSIRGNTVSGQQDFACGTVLKLTALCVFMVMKEHVSPSVTHWWVIHSFKTTTELYGTQEKDLYRDLCWLGSAHGICCVWNIHLPHLLTADVCMQWPISILCFVLLKAKTNMCTAVCIIMCALQMAVNETELKQWVAEQLFCLCLSLTADRKKARRQVKRRERKVTDIRTHKYLSFNVCEYTHLI